MTALEERLEAGNATAWRPDQDDPDIIIGVITDIDSATSEYGTYPIVTVRLDDGTEKAIHAMRTVLRNELMRLRPQIGEKIGVKDLGDIATKPGSKFKSYHGYKVKVEREAQTFDWGTLGAPVDDEWTAQADAEAAAQAVDKPVDAGDDSIPF